MTVEIRSSVIPVANVASVPQRSPLRYPGGKTWLIPHIRAWLKCGAPHPLLVEPFAGGGTVSLTAVDENLVEKAIMVELDRDIAAFWRAVLCCGPDLAERVEGFRPTRKRIEKLERQAPNDVVEHAFRTLVMNRTRRGGVLAPGATLIKQGEYGNGVASRWYPETLKNRLTEIQTYADRITFCETDGMRFLEDVAIHRADACFFLDPPYGTAGKGAGSRLYAHSVVDHAKLFELMAVSEGNFLMTYNYSDDIVPLVRAHGFHAAVVVMKNTHHLQKRELIITRDRLFT